MDLREDQPNAFAGQGHRIRSPTPNPGDRNAQDPVPPARPSGGIGIADHVLGDNRRSDAGDLPQVNRDFRLPSVPGRAEADSHVPLGRERKELCRCRIGLTLRRGVRGTIQGLVLGPIVQFQFPQIGMKVGAGVRGLLIGSLRSGVGSRETKDNPR